MKKDQGGNINFINFLKSNSGLEFEKKEDLPLISILPEKALIKPMPRKNNLEKVLQKHIPDERQAPGFDIEEHLVRENSRIIHFEKFEFLKNLTAAAGKRKRTWHFRFKRLAKREVSFMKMAQFLKSKFLLPELAFTAAIVLLFFIFIGSADNLSAKNVVKKLNQVVFNIDSAVGESIQDKTDSQDDNQVNESDGRVAGISETNVDLLKLPPPPPLPSAPEALSANPVSGNE